MTDPHVDNDSPVNIARFQSSVLGARICEIIWRYEREMTRTNKQKYVAVRTRQQLLRNGPVQTVKTTVSRRPSVGFKYLITRGRAQDTYEWLALEDPRFKSLWEKAASRLFSHGIRKYPGYDHLMRDRKPLGRPPRLAA